MGAFLATSVGLTTPAKTTRRLVSDTPSTSAIPRGSPRSHSRVVRYLDRDVDRCRPGQPASNRAEQLWAHPRSDPGHDIRLRAQWVGRIELLGHRRGQIGQGLPLPAGGVHLD